MGVEASRRPRRLPDLPPPGPGPIWTAPRVARPPAVVGAGLIGAPHSADLGAWTGLPTPSLAAQWQRDGADIPGALGATFAPGAAEDAAGLRLRVTAWNSQGAVTAFSEEIFVHHAPPTAQGRLPDLTLFLNSGVQGLNAFPDFTGNSLTFGVTGEGVAIDPATGMVSIATDRLRDGVEVTITAANSGGAATSVFRVTVLAVTVPLLVTAPALAGPGLIGSAHSVDAGVWDGAVSLASRWRRDGVDIPGAVEPTYTPVAADDLAELTCLITATNAAGDSRAETAALRVTYAAPVAAGALEDLRLELDSGAAIVAAANDFTGAALRYAVSGAGATIDAVTGVVSLPTTALVASETVTVTASNSGGAAETSFAVTVEAPAVVVAAPEAIGVIADVSFELDSGARTVSTQAHFSGTDLVYALQTAPAGTTIHAGSGLVSIPTTTPLVAARITVGARNAAGSAVQSFAVTVRAAMSLFTTAAALGDMSFVSEAVAPAWTLVSNTFGRLTPATTGRAHGDWRLAGGDGRYRCLVRWNATNASVNGSSPFVFGAGIARSGANFTGLYVEASRVSGTARQLRLLRYTGSGALTTLLGSVASAWVWYNWYWLELEIIGGSVKARLYPEAAAAPDWQLVVDTTQIGAGAFGPSGFPINGVSPAIDVKRLEFAFPNTVNPPVAALNGDWELGQVTEPK